MIESRRCQLNALTHSHASHAGLWLDRYLTAQIERGETLDPKQKKPLVTLMGETVGMQIPEAYRAFYARWKQSLAALGAQCRSARVLGRMVVGLGDESVLETSVALHHTYGVPYIPGSALKGMAARFARERLGEQWREGSDAYRTIFGDTANAGYISFFDALYVPESGFGGHALHPDVITVHHPKYYQGEKDAAPADWDSPTPIPFLSATGSYMVALSGPERWVDATFDILGHALRELGVGAKTSSGYGRMELDKKSVDPIQSQVEDLQSRIAALPVGRVTNDINKFYQEWKQLEAPMSMRLRVARAILDKVAQAGRVKASAEKPWYRDLAAYIADDGRQ